MDVSLTTIISVAIGSAITFLANYVLEARRLKNDKYKYTRDKMISVGEDFYRFSAYALMHFETQLDNYETLKNYTTQEARDNLSQTAENTQQLVRKLAENHITITSADIFYGVSNMEVATSMTHAYKAASANFEETLASDYTDEQYQASIEAVKTILKELILTVKKDREIIKEKIVEILGVNSKQLLN